MIHKAVIAGRVFHIVDTFYDKDIPQVLRVGEMKIKGALGFGDP